MTELLIDELVESVGVDHSSAKFCLRLTLWDMLRGRLSNVAFAPCGNDGSVQIVIDDKTWIGRIANKTCLVPAGIDEQFGVTVFTGACVDPARPEAMVMVVNCGQEPPTLQVALGVGSPDARSWSWRITHQIQSDVLTLIS